MIAPALAVLQLCVVAFAGWLLLCTPTFAQTAGPCNRQDMERNFIRQFQEINRNIRNKQALLERMITDPEASEHDIKEMTRELIFWRARRDNLAIDYILRARRDECPIPDLTQIRSR